MAKLWVFCCICTLLCGISFATEDDVSMKDINDIKNLENSIIWTWVCEENKCVKKKAPDSGTVCKDENCDKPLSLAVCKLTCPPGTLWPKPSGPSVISKTIVPINPNSIYIKTTFRKQEDDNTKDAERTKMLVKGAGKIFTDSLTTLFPGSLKVLGKNLEISLILNQPSHYKFTQDVDECYQLTISTCTDGGINVTIAAENFIGGRHGLETLSQLIVFDDLSRALVLPNEVTISDKPTYKYRGILVDTARNFISVPTIKRTLDAMAMFKLNTFHWHITDSQSFPFTSESFPLLTKYGAYSPDKVYTKEDIKELVEYAKIRGIRIIPEFDAPAHVGEGWQWAGDNVTVCFNKEPWHAYCVEPPCGQLNPTSEKMYSILEGIYKDMENVFDSDVFHMGGDEVNINCWNTSAEVTDNMKQMGLGRNINDFLDLWSIFQNKALSLLEKVSGKQRKVILWTSTLIEEGLEKYLDKSKYIIQIWTKGNDSIIREIVDKGFPVIFSNYDALYLDCGFGAWVGTGNNWCSPYIPWQNIYENDPIKLLKSFGTMDQKNLDLVLGAEAALWTEQADDSSIDNRLWPRSIAMAERLWTGKGNWKEAETRYIHQRERMIKRNISPDTVQPQWCYQNQESCYNSII